jgi:hypothetical protein
MFFKIGFRWSIETNDSQFAALLVASFHRSLELLLKIFVLYGV